ACVVCSYADATGRVRHHGRIGLGRRPRCGRGDALWRDVARSPTPTLDERVFEIERHAVAAGHRSVSGISNSSHSASHTVLTDSPDSMASCAVRPPHAARWWLRTRWSDRSSPNASTVRARNSVRVTVHAPHYRSTTTGR